MHRCVSDSDTSTGAAVHVAQLQRRERRRLTQLLQACIRSDGTLRDLRDPIWSSPPVGAPPSSGNPAAHWANKPWCIGDISNVPTHRSIVPHQWRRLRVAHMCHCERCQAHSTSVHGHAPPLDALCDVHRSRFRRAAGPLHVVCRPRVLSVRDGQRGPHRPQPAAAERPRAHRDPEREKLLGRVGGRRRLHG